jgi:hypothetical protein
LSKYFLASLNSFFIVFFAYFVFLSILSWQESIELLDTGGLNIDIGSYLYLPLGAFAFCWVIYRKWGLPGQFLISILMSFYWELDSNIFIQFTLINVLGPVVAVSIFRVLEVYKFKDIKSETTLAILFLCIVLALLNSLSKFFIYFMTENQFTSAFDFLATYLPGDIIGSFVFIIFATFMMKIFHLGQYKI